MGVSYPGGRTPESLSAALERRKKMLADEAEQIVAETVAEAQVLQKRMLNLAVTPTGQKRIAGGGSGTEGRNDSGDLIDAISGDVKRPTRTRVEGRWGWLDPGNNPRGKIMAQDWGTAKIPAAHSLLDSYMAIRATFYKRIRRLGR